MSYRLRYSEETRRALRILPGFYRQRVKRIVEQLSEEARPAKAKAPRDLEDGWRIRVGSWRIIYQVDEDGGEIYILASREKTGPETYQDLLADDLTKD